MSDNRLKDKAVDRKGSGTDRDYSSAARALEERAMLLEKAATSSGVLEYLRRPIVPAPRARANELFLQNTLRSVFHSNRRAQEDAMWDQRELEFKRLECERSRGTKDAKEVQAVSQDPTDKSKDKEDESPSSISSGHSDGKDDRKHDGWVMSEEELQAMLSRHRAKGRGGVGSRIDEVGPFLPTDDAEVKGREDAEHVIRKMLKGPEIPSWMSKTSVNDILEMDATELSRRMKEGKRSKKKKDKKSGKLKDKEKKKKKKEKDSSKEPKKRKRVRESD